ncbi:MAG: hypothetical protein IPK17_32235 [Chloroflexi bacterium]|uniref:hypothetical protein n=1 Tax=Candidatus Flexifilum breve TaxID=3140694 RepID=UPI0031362BAF|nr:hypothetical protein [Chloroflexota bacterium]
MNPLELGILITVVTLVIVGIIMVVTLLILSRVSRAQIAKAREQFPQALAVLNANFAGLTADPSVRLRGNGILVITRDELYFKQWVTNREFRVPIRGIQSVELVSNFMGRWSFTPILKVNFTGAEGEAAAIGWHVRDAESVKQQIETLIK